MLVVVAEQMVVLAALVVVELLEHTQHRAQPLERLTLVAAAVVVNT